MTNPPPNLAALYLRHRDAMYRVAASVLREAGRSAGAEDAVSDAITSIMASPPSDVLNWEAFLVTAAKRKAVDLLRSAAVRHAGPELVQSDHERYKDGTDLAEDVAEALDRQALAAVAWDCLAVLGERERYVVWQIAALERPQREVAAELGLTPPRISQILRQGLDDLSQEVKRKGVNNG